MIALMRPGIVWRGCMISPVTGERWPVGSCGLSSESHWWRRRAPRPRTSPETAAPIRIGAFGFPESTLLAKIYGRALEDHGYRVELRPALGSREVVTPPSNGAQVASHGLPVRAAGLDFATLVRDAHGLQLGGEDEELETLTRYLWEGPRRP